MILAYHGEPPAWGRHSKTVNSFYSFWFIEKGSVQVRIGQEELSLAAREWILFPPHLRRRQDFSAGTVIYSLGFEASWSNGLPWMRFDSPIRGLRNDAVDDAIALIERLAGGRPPGYRILAEQDVTSEVFTEVHGRMFQMLACLTPALLQQGAESDPVSRGDLRLERILRELHKTPSIRPLPYSRWQREVGLSRVRIDRLAKEKLALTPKQIRDRCLLAALKRVFLTRNASVKEAAVEFGFSDSSHLCRWFRRHAGISPMDYRTVGTI